MSRPTTPTPLTGGSGRRLGPLGREMRPAPKISLDLVEPEIARMVAWGWDSVQMAYPYAPDCALVAKLDKFKGLAQSRKQDGDGKAVIDIGGEMMTIAATGAKGGVAYRLETPSVQYLIRGEGCEWGVSVRYLSAGLWLYGWDVLRDEVQQFLDDNFVRTLTDEPRVTRADYAFDFYSPLFSWVRDFTKLRHLIVAHSSVKTRINSEIWGTSVKDQTITMGKVNSLQVTIYDKCAEITDISGKEWMRDVWLEAALGEVFWEGKKINNVWRLEVRMGKGFLKERNATPVSQFREYWRTLLMEALVKIRLASPYGEACIRNRPMHPFWSLAYEHVDDHGAEIMPLGRRVTGARSALLARAQRQIAGAVRSASVLAGLHPDDEGLQAILERAREIAINDPDHVSKTKAARERYEFIDEAR